MSIIWADLTPRERDAEVAIWVMEWEFNKQEVSLDGEHYKSVGWMCGDKRILMLPEFTTEISAAWQVIEKMQKDGFGVNVLSGKSGMNVECEVYHFDSGHVVAYESGSTAEEAICLAALKTYEVEVVT